jgi:hypothetical protein
MNDQKPMEHASEALLFHAATMHEQLSASSTYHALITKLQASTTQVFYMNHSVKQAFFTLHLPLLNHSHFILLLK